MAFSEHLKFSFRFLRYWLTAVNDHSLHPPFIYRFYNNVLIPAKSEPVFGFIDRLRKDFSKRNDFIEVRDLGAGSVYSSTSKRRISEIVRNSSSESKIARLLFHCGRYHKAKNVLELGTSLGLTTQYLAAIGEECSVDTVEGSEAIYELAYNHLKNRENVNCHLGQIDEVLPKYLNEIEHVDLAYLDANHTFEATMRYVKMILPKVLPSSIIVVGDIHWSEGMERAWKSLCALEQVTLSVDLFHCGLLFFLPVKEKQDYVISF